MQVKTPKNKQFYLLIFLCSCAFAHLCSYVFAQDDGEINGFSLVQYEEGGAKKWELSGKTAELEGDKVKINEISALAFGDRSALKLKAREGNFDRESEVVRLKENVIIKSTDGTRLTSDSLDWYAETKDVWTESPVNIRKSDFEVEGVGAVCNLVDKTAELKKDVKANVNSEASSPAVSGDRNKSRTTITCDGPLEINYNKNRAIFRNNVKVEDPQGNIFADRIDVYFDEDTRKIKSVVASGNVRLVNGENVTYSEKAIYLVEQGRIVLPKRPKLVIQSGHEE